MSFFIYNDKIYEEGTPVITPDNRSFKYGDGLFETLKVNNGIIQLKDYHFERLNLGMKTLQFKVPEYFTASFFAGKIAELCKSNSLSSSVRVRLIVFRGNGGLNDLQNNFPNYIIQAWKNEQTLELNSTGLMLGLYPDAKKSCDLFANIKSNNFLSYAMAALYAKKINVDDCILLNNYDRVCDSTIANIFMIKNDIIYTPPLSEGCIAGVMRRFVIKTLQQSKFKLIEKPVSVEDIENADELFLTNSIHGIRWVSQFKNVGYKNNWIRDIYKLVNPADN